MSAHVPVDLPAVLLALLWSPPDAARFASADDAHARGQALYQQLTGLPPTAAVPAVERAVLRAAAADLFPGDGPDDQWTALELASVAHPFAGRGAQRAPIVLPGEDEVREAIDGIRGNVQDTHELWQLALAVWCLLPDAVRAPDGDARVDGDWRTRSPLAHPAYPDPVEAVSALRAAVAAAGDEPAVLLFSLASVQEYIGEARRTQDLWMGSYLYAYFIWHAIRAVIQELGPWAIITPSLRGHPFVDLWLRGEGINITSPKDLLEIASLPNIFAAVVPQARGEALAQAALAGLAAARDKVAGAVKARLEAAANSKDAYPLHPGHAAWLELWDAQIAELATSDVFWALVPWESASKDQERLAVMAGPDRVNEAWLRWVREAESLGAVGTGAGFPLAAELAARLLTARKNRRDFAQAPEGTAGGLCTLCAARTALRPEGVKTGAFWQTLARVGHPNKLQGRIRSGEQLCAPCVMKRLAGEAYFARGAEGARAWAHEELLTFDYHRFPSTATVATAPFRKRLRDALGTEEGEYVEVALDEWLKELNKAVQPGDRIPANVPRGLSVADRALDLQALDALDGSWLDPNAYQVEAVKREFGLTETAHAEAKQGEVSALALGEARRCFKMVWEELQAWAQARPGTDVRPPAHYYAVLALDGDKIGEWLRGVHNATFQELLDPVVAGGLDADPKRAGALTLRRPPGPLSQMALAEAGHTFALLEAPQLVEAEARGAWLVYSGGDDVLALASREAALPLADTLRKAFCRYATENGELLLGAQASISAAIVIAHVSAPLGGVIREAHAALKQVAKAAYGRNAFVVRVLKRSGPPIDAGLPWHVTDSIEDIDAAGAFAAVSEAIASGLLSRGLLTDVRALAPALGTPQPASPLGLGTRAPAPPSLETHAQPEHLFLWYAARHLNSDWPKEEQADALEALRQLFRATRLALDERQKGGTFRRYPRMSTSAERPSTWGELTELLRAAEFLAREDEE
jgi:CRISPR-associated protein Cmr2